MKAQPSFAIERVDSVVLEENLVLLSTIDDVSVREDDGLLHVASSDAALVVQYALSGHQLRVLGQAGRGPGEYDRPTHIQYDLDGRAVIWDAGSFKYLRFDSLGTLMDEWTGFQSALSGFSVMRDQIVAMKGGGSLTNVLLRMDLATGESKSFGQVPFDHIVLDLLAGAGPFVAASPDGSIFVANASSVDVHEISALGDTLRLLSANSEILSLERGRYSTRAQVQAAMADRSIIPYLQNSSRLQAIFAPTNEQVFSVLEHTGPAGRRYQEVVVYSSSGSSIAQFVVKEKLGRLVDITPHRLYFLQEQLEGGELLRTLSAYEWRVSQ